MNGSADNRQVKSRQRVADHGEVFTAQREVDAMLDLVKEQTERIEATFLEPACGNGNFLAEVLRRKLAVVERKHQTQTTYERNAIIAVSSIYGVDILEDNANECRERLFRILDEHYTTLYKAACNPDYRKSVLFLLERNILWGDATTYKHPKTEEPIVFSEWKPINGSLMKRRDFIFRFLVEGNHQFSLFNDMGDCAAIDEPMNKHYPPVHYLKLANAVANEL